MDNVYVYDMTDGLVKISEKGGNYYVYPLKEVRLKKGQKPNFVFEKRPKKTWNYKPYEDEDVSLTPQPFLDDVKKFSFYKLRQVI
jgi:hypothetical protein